KLSFGTRATTMIIEGGATRPRPIPSGVRRPISARWRRWADPVLHPILLPFIELRPMASFRNRRRGWWRDGGAVLARGLPEEVRADPRAAARACHLPELPRIPIGNRRLRFANRPLLMMTGGAGPCNPRRP